MAAELRETGIEVLGGVPWGTHFCQFYQTKQDLIDILVPYFRAGLENNEFCVWVTSEFLTAAEATQAMLEGMPGFMDYLRNGQMEIFPHTEWYLKGGVFEMNRVLKDWVAKHDYALARGFSGTRVSGNPFWIDCKKDWDDFAAYEAAINTVIHDYKLVVLCTYSLDKCNSNEIIDVVGNHEFALVKREGVWANIESAAHREMEQALIHAKESLQKTNTRLEILSQTAGNLLASNEPQKIVNELCSRVMEHLDCQVFFNFLVDEKVGKLHLNACAGVPEKTAGSLEWLDFGVAVCGCVARDGARLICENIPETPDPRTDLVKSFGVKAYACHPLMAGGQVIGTLSFGTKTRTHFAEDEIAMMKVVADQVAVAMERKRTEEVLLRNEADLNRAQEVARTGSWRLDVRRNQLSWSRETYRIFGLPYGTPQTYESFIAAIHPDDQNMVDSRWQAALHGERYEVQHRILVNGQTRWVQETAELEFDDRGEVLGGFGTVQDITERKQGEVNLMKEKAFSETAINSLPGVFYLFREDGKFLLWNRNLEKVTGYSAEEIAAMSPLDFFGPDYREVIAAAIHQAFTSGEVRVEADFHTKNGERVPYDFTGLRIVIDGLPLLIGAGIDITERKQAEEKLKAAVTELSRSNEELEQFAYVASHDLQQPLRMVSSYVQLLSRRYKGKLDSDADEFIGYAVDGATRMQQLISDLLDYSRVGTRGREFSPFDTNSALNKALANLKMTISETKAEITADKLPVIRGDEAQFAQLFQNLVDNAIKFRDTVAPRIHISAAWENNAWRFTISDNGIGIDPKHKDRIFLIFQRLHPAKQYPGTGIGLAICKKIVERHGGRIWAEPAQPKGTVFNFTVA